MHLIFFTSHKIWTIPESYGLWIAVTVNNLNEPHILKKKLSERVWFVFIVISTRVDGRRFTLKFQVHKQSDDPSGGMSFVIEWHFSRWYEAIWNKLSDVVPI